MKLTPEQLKQFDEEGYLFFPNYFSPEETAILKGSIPEVFAQRREENVREKTGDVVRTAFAVHTYHPVFEALVHHPRFVEPAEQLLRDKTYIHQFKINGKAAFDGDVWQWHQDYGTWKNDDDMPNCHAMNLAIFLDEVMPINGPLMLVPRSQNAGDLKASHDLETTSYPLWTLDEFAETRIAQRLSMVNGVAQVQVLGAQKYAVHVQLDPAALASHNVGINEVENALRAWNVNLPTGQITGPQRSFALQTSGQLTSADHYRSLVVAYRNGIPVRLEELGDLVDSVEDDKTASWFYTKNDDQRSIVLAIQRQPGTNTIEVVDAIKKILPTFREQIPPSVEINVLYDRSVSIRESVEEVQFSLILALALVVMVIFLFLRNFSATLIPSLALPMSIVGTFAIMHLFGFSLNNLSLMALTLCVGFVVDDAIVMLENISRHMEMGKSAMHATLDGSKEIAFTILSMTLSLAAVFIPVLFMSGMLGRLLNEFAITIMAAVLVSGVVSLTLTPMLCARWLKPQHNARHGWLYNALERLFEAWKNAYDVTLRWVLRHSRFTMVVFIAIFVVTGWMFVKMPKDFLPSEDSGQLFAFTEAAQDVSFDEMARLQQQAAALVKEDAAVESVMSFIGQGGGGASWARAAWVSAMAAGLESAASRRKGLFIW